MHLLENVLRDEIVFGFLSSIFIVVSALLIIYSCFRFHLSLVILLPCHFMGNLVIFIFRRWGEKWWTSSRYTWWGYDFASFTGMEESFSWVDVAIHFFLWFCLQNYSLSRRLISVSWKRRKQMNLYACFSKWMERP